MIRVHSHVGEETVTNPFNGTVKRMVKVRFVEESARGGGVGDLGATSAFLSQIAGEEVGLGQIRVHTQLVDAEKISAFPVGKSFEGYINRRLHSVPQIPIQQEVEARMVDGKPTYFTTSMGPDPMDDIDQRVPNEVLLTASPDAVFKAQLRTARVELITQGQEQLSGKEQAGRS